VRLKGTPPQLKKFPPWLGQHSREVVREVGYSEDEIKQMAEEGVFG